MAAGKDRHYGEAEVVQAEESEVMNAAGGAPPPFLTSRKANKKRAPVFGTTDALAKKGEQMSWVIVPRNLPKIKTSAG